MTSCTVKGSRYPESNRGNRIATQCRTLPPHLLCTGSCAALGSFSFINGWVCMMHISRGSGYRLTKRRVQWRFPFPITSCISKRTQRTGDCAGWHTATFNRAGASSEALLMWTSFTLHLSCACHPPSPITTLPNFQYVNLPRGQSAPGSSCRATQLLCCSWKDKWCKTWGMCWGS